MQLDKTRIAIRERTQIELLDLSLHVMRGYGKKILMPFLLGVIPLALLNHFLIGWMGSSDYVDYGVSYVPVRFVWNMSLLVFLEAPLASIFATAYLGRAVFEEKPTMGDVWREFRRAWAQVLVCLTLLRGPAVAWVLLFLARDEGEFTFYESILLLVVGFVGLVRAIRPFMTEIVMLEHNPWTSPNPNAMTLSRRLNLLHAAVNANLFPRWLATAFVSVVLTGALAHGLLAVSGYFGGSWRWGPILVNIGIPATMWVVVMYVTIVRFLSYLDVRIRNEGWEVELQLKAEVSRLVRGAIR